MCLKALHTSKATLYKQADDIHTNYIFTIVRTAVNCLINFALCAVLSETLIQQ